MGRTKKLALFGIVLAAIAATGWWTLYSGDPTGFAKGKRVEFADFKGSDPTGAPANLANADLVVRGEYLTRAADCAACHTAPGDKPFAGGLPFKLPMIGTIYSTNITPDRETGIGAWSDEEFLKALHQGIGKDGEHQKPMMVAKNAVTKPAGLLFGNSNRGGELNLARCPKHLTGVRRRGDLADAQT